MESLQGFKSDEFAKKSFKQRLTETDGDIEHQCKMLFSPMGPARWRYAANLNDIQY